MTKKVNRLFVFIDLQYDERTGELLRATKHRVLSENVVDARLKVSKKLPKECEGRPVTHSLQYIDR